jgi:hypothetical protein
VFRFSWKWRKRSPIKTVFYRWQKEFFENGASAFELMAEHVALKKALGEL